MFNQDTRIEVPGDGNGRFVETDFCGDYDIPEPIDQWALDDFEQIHAATDHDDWRGYR